MGIETDAFQLLILLCLGLFARAGGWIKLHSEPLESRPETLDLKPIIFLFALLIGYLAIGWIVVLKEFGWAAVVNAQGGG